MTKQTQNPENNAIIDDEADALDIPVMSRKATLKARADKMGITYSPNIGENALAQKILDHEVKTEGIVSALVDNEDSVDISAMSKRDLRMLARKEAQKLIRVNVMPNDPMKSQMLGEVILTGNAQIGTIGKLIPFGTPRGYHVPIMVYKILKEKTYTHFIVKKDKFDNEIVHTVQRPAYNIEVLPPISDKQLKRIAERQQAQAKYEEDTFDNTDLDD